MLGPSFFVLLLVLASISLPVKAGAAVLFEDDFESSPGGTVIGIAVIAEGEVAHSGSKALKLKFTRNEQGGGMDVKMKGSDHIFTRWYDYYAQQFDFAYGMKIHRIQSFNEQRQLNDWDSVVVPWGEGKGERGRDLSGINDMRTISILNNGGPGNWNGVWADMKFERGRWYCVEAEMKLNTPGQNDGEVSIWVGGEQVIHRTGMDLRGGLSSPVNTVLFGGWYSNGAAGENPQPDPAVPSIRYIDDVAISTTRIGCLPDVADTTPPRQPTGLRVEGQ